MTLLSTKITRPLAAALLPLLLMACQGESTVQLNGNQIAVPIPDKLRQVAALRPAELRLRVSINNVAQDLIPVSWTINSPVEDENVGTVTVLMPAEQINTIKIEWLMSVDSQNVLLADFSSNVLPGQTELLVDSYLFKNDSRFDTDGDGRWNLEEAIDNRNLLSEFDAEVSFSTTFLGANLVVRDDGKDTDLSGDEVEPDPQDTTFGLRHDGTDLIVYVCGQDNVPFVDSDNQFWHDDAIFIYLDGANSDNSSYDQIDDFQLAFVRDADEIIVAKGGSGSSHSCPNGSCITYFEFYTFTSSCAYEFVVHLPLEALNMTIGEPVGFDIEFTDDDNGDRRDSSRAWIGFSDASDVDPSTFGTIILR